MKKRIALFGGSFNPPHIGHYKVAELVRDSFACDELWLLVSGNRKDKQMSVADAHRLELAHIMADELQKENGPKIKVSTVEIERSTPTRTIDTLKSLEEKYPDHEFHFVVSSELVPQIREHWDHGEELFNKAKYVVVERPGTHKISDIELPPFATTLNNLSVFPEISSTSIRNINSEQDLRTWATPQVADYIIKNKIYGFQSAD